MRGSDKFPQSLDRLEALSARNVDVRPLRCKFTSVAAAWVEPLRERMSEAERRVEGLFESLWIESFSN